MITGHRNYRSYD